MKISLELDLEKEQDYKMFLAIVDASRGIPFEK